MAHKLRMRSAAQGFTLAEMAIVITIIGVMTGGIMVGQSMIHNSRMQATISKVTEYTGAVIKFRDRYFALPGDMPNATDMWGAVSNTSACVDQIDPSDATAGDSFTTAGAGTETCNGNGDGMIGGNVAADDCSIQNWELFRAWKHLANAGEIEQGNKFTGFHGDTGKTDAQPGVNVPKAPLDGGGFTLLFCGSISGVTPYFDGAYGHVIQVGKGNKTTGTGQRTRLPLFTAEDAMAIDKKVDDSYPHTGNVLGPRMNETESPNCTDSNAAAPAVAAANYDLTQKSEPKCPLFFKLGF